MNYYEKNMECIHQVRPRLFSQIQDYTEKKENTEKLDIVTEPARDGSLYTKVIRDGQEYRLNSNYRPLEEAKCWAMQFSLDSLNIVVQMFGLGNGYFVREIRKKLKKEDHMIVVEPSFELFCHVINNYDMTDVLSDTKISLAITEISSSMLKVLLSERVHWMNYNSQMYCVHPQYEKCFAKEHEEYIAKLKDYNFTTSVNRNTEAYFGVDIVENTLDNYKYIPGSNYLLELKGKIPKDIPAIIVAAGPSLDQNIEDLKRAKGRAVIIATDTALRSLHKHGITADFAVTLDPKKPPSYFENAGCEQIPMFIESSANREALKYHKGRKIWFGCHDFVNYLYHKFGYQISVYNTGGSVATAAFSICKTLGFETTILIGQDLAYKGEITHADGQIVNVQAEETGICYVEGMDGKQIKSRHDWFIFLKWFENSIEETKKMGRVIDATEGGALIHGTEIMTLNEAIDQYCKKDINISKILDQLPPTFSDEQNQVVKEYLNQAYEDTVYISKEAEEIIEKCDTALRISKKPNYAKKLESLGKDIVKQNQEVASKPVYSLLDNYIVHETARELENMCKVGSGEEGEFEKTFETSKMIFQTIISAADKVEPLLKEAIEQIEKTC